MTQKNKGNLKAKKSKIKISNALIELLEDIPYENITISKLAETAQLSRRTFYRNYSTKDDIINEFYLKLWAEYHYELNQQNDLSLANVALVFFKKMEEYSHILTLFNNNDLFVLYLNSIPDLMIESYKKREEKVSDLPLSSQQYIAYFISGGFFLVAKHWFDNGQKESPEELAESVSQLNNIY